MHFDLRAGKVWDKKLFTLKHTLQGHTGSVLALEIAEEKKWLFSSSGMPHFVRPIRNDLNLLVQEIALFGYVSCQDQVDSPSRSVDLVDSLILSHLRLESIPGDCLGGSLRFVVVPYASDNLRRLPRHVSSMV